MRTRTRSGSTPCRREGDDHARFFGVSVFGDQSRETRTKQTTRGRDTRSGVVVDTTRRVERAPSKLCVFFIIITTAIVVAVSLVVVSPAFAPRSPRLLPSFVGVRGRGSWMARVWVPRARRAASVRRRARASRNSRATPDGGGRCGFFVNYKLVHHARGHRGASLARAAVFHGHAREGLLDVHASPSPGGFLTGRTGGLVAHSRAGVL